VGAHDPCEAERFIAELAGLLGIGGWATGVDAGDQGRVQSSRASAAFTEVEGLIGICERFTGLAEVPEAAHRGACKVGRGKVTGPCGLVGAADPGGGSLGVPQRFGGAAWNTPATPAEVNRLRSRHLLGSSRGVGIRLVRDLSAPFIGPGIARVATMLDTWVDGLGDPDRPLSEIDGQIAAALTGHRPMLAFGPI
jgi:hypothetical protein